MARKPKTVPAPKTVQEVAPTTPEPVVETVPLDESPEARAERLHALLVKRGATTAAVGIGSTQRDGASVLALHVYVMRGELRRIPSDDTFEGVAVVYHPDNGPIVPLSE